MFGELIQSADNALGFRRSAPMPEPPRRLLVLLHGWNSDETQLAEMGKGVDEATLVVLPRGLRSAGGNAFGWYRVRFDDGEPNAMDDEVEDSAARLLEFIGQLQSHHDVGPSRTLIAGFSQGAALAARIALTQPCVGGLAMFSGRILPDVEAAFAPIETLAALRALIAHGRQDETLPPIHAAHTAAILERCGIEHQLRLYDTGHALTRSMQADAVRWLRDACQPWNA